MGKGPLSNDEDLFDDERFAVHISDTLRTAVSVPTCTWRPSWRSAEPSPDEMRHTAKGTTIKYKGIGMLALMAKYRAKMSGESEGEEARAA